jgi:hypothetical protein
MVIINVVNNLVPNRQKATTIPDEVLTNYLSNEELSEFRNGGTGIFSITVSGYKI